jgi:hypothetical protein
MVEVSWDVCVCVCVCVHAHRGLGCVNKLADMMGCESMLLHKCCLHYQGNVVSSSSRESVTQ